jgi:hypothetical protein
MQKMREAFEYMQENWSCMQHVPLYLNTSIDYP